MRSRSSLVLLRALGALALTYVGGCSSVDYTVFSGPRDWRAHPAVVDLPAPKIIYAISDIHGAQERLAALLTVNGIAAPSTTGMRWTASDAVLVVVGDLIDKGPQPLEVIETFQVLEKGAEAAGGHVVTLFGNHEPQFFIDPFNHRARSRYGGIDNELEADDLSPVSLASGLDPRGAWLRNRPFAARVGNWFFAHAGDTQGRTLAEIEEMARFAVDVNNFDDDSLLGTTGLLESKYWFQDDETRAPRYAKNVGVDHIVFGHEPHSFLPEGSIRTTQGGAVFAIDCGMSPRIDYSHGRILRVTRAGALDIADSLDETGAVVNVWRGPARDALDGN